MFREVRRCGLRSADSSSGWPAANRISGCPSWRAQATVHASRTRSARKCAIATGRALGGTLQGKQCNAGRAPGNVGSDVPVRWPRSGLGGGKAGVLRPCGAAAAAGRRHQAAAQTRSSLHALQQAQRITFVSHHNVSHALEPHNADCMHPPHACIVRRRQQAAAGGGSLTALSFHGAQAAGPACCPPIHNTARSLGPICVPQPAVPVPAVKPMPSPVVDVMTWPGVATLVTLADSAQGFEHVGRLNPRGDR